MLFNFQYKPILIFKIDTYSNYLPLMKALRIVAAANFRNNAEVDNTNAYNYY